MPVKKGIIIGLTGSFGSGCSTLADALVEKKEFELFSLSKLIKEKFKGKEGREPTLADRKILQDIGNILREKKGNHFLAEYSLKRYEDKLGSGDIKEESNIIFDNIRNTGEVEYFRRKLPNFYLVAVDAPALIRWERVKNDYYDAGLNERNFKVDDKRDKNEGDIPHGQKVQFCVDRADILLSNLENYRYKLQENLLKNSKRYINLMFGLEEDPQPEEQELYMSTAYSISLLSKCIKRKVGAVILNETNNVVSVGYNENPKTIDPCIEADYKGCYKDIKKIENIKTHKGKPCPDCGTKFGKLNDVPYRCKNKKCNLDLWEYVGRDKGMLPRCTAIHAEEHALLNAKFHDLNNCNLYVTTYPCFTCAQKIIEVGIKEVCYAEPYPDPDSIDLLANKSKVKMTPFEGVKARAFFKLYGPYRE